jgi:hypothetical protein
MIASLPTDDGQYTMLGANTMMVRKSFRSRLGTPSATARYQK